MTDLHELDRKHSSSNLFHRLRGALVGHQENLVDWLHQPVSPETEQRFWAVCAIALLGLDLVFASLPTLRESHTVDRSQFMGATPSVDVWKSSPTANFQENVVYQAQPEPVSTPGE